MRINKLLIVSPLALSATVAPITLTTSCSNSWGHKVPVSIGSVEKDNPNNPYCNFANSTLEDADGRKIIDYLPSNYILDSSTNAYYSYATPIATWTETKDNKTTKLKPENWTIGTSSWYTSNPGFTTSATCEVEESGKKYSITEACAQNVTLTANTSFIVSIAQFINKYVNYALNYATSQVHDDADFAVAWGGNIPNATEETKKVLYEWMFANANSHATSETEVFLKSTQTNFNFAQNSFPIPSYRTAEGQTYKEPSSETRKLLSGADDKLGENAPTIYWSEKTENGKDDDKYTVYTYPAVPVLIRTRNLTQRWINPKISGSIFTNDYYQNDSKKIKEAIGNSWSSMKEKTGTTEPSILKYDIHTQEEGKTVTFTDEDKNVDARIKALNPKGSDFIAFITYSYVEWAKPNVNLNRNNTVTLTSLQTIMPAYLFTFKNNMFKKAKSDKNNSGNIIDLEKADKYSTELINLLSRNSNEGRIAKASNLSKESKEYLQFLYYLFAKNDKFDFDFVQTTALQK